MTNIIYAYTRKQAVEDGEQVDVSATAAEAGIRFPVFLTRRVFNNYVAVPPEAIGQDEAGRLWDIVWMLRLSEGLNVMAGCVDLSQKAIVFETLKQRRRGVFRAVPVPDDLISLLKGLVADVESSARVWNFSRATAYRMVKAHMISAGVNGVMASPKGLRHGFGVACTTNKILLPTIKKWMGHARMETTAIYLDVSGEEERELARRLWKAEKNEAKK